MCEEASHPERPICRAEEKMKRPCRVGRVEKRKNGFGSYGYYFFNVFWYVENGGNFFFGHWEHLDKWNFT